MIMNSVSSTLPFQVAAATTGMLSLFVTTASILEYGIRYHFRYVLNLDAIWFFAIGIFFHINLSKYIFYGYNLFFVLCTSSLGVCGGLSGKRIMQVKRFPSSVMILALILILVIDMLLFVYYLSTKEPDYSTDNFCDE